MQPRDFTGMADPYAKIRLLPDRSNVWQTRIHKRTLNPGTDIYLFVGMRQISVRQILFSRTVFDEDFVFEERPTIIGRRTIEILVYDFDAYSRHICIGGTQIDLSQIDLSKKANILNPLLPCTEQVPTK